MVRLPLIISPTVWPSPAWATASAPMLPPAPTRLSTTTGWPSAFSSGSASARAVRSGDEPAGKPTTMRSGRVGQAERCALAGACVSSSARPAAASTDRRRGRRAVMARRAAVGKRAIIRRPCGRVLPRAVPQGRPPVSDRRPRGGSPCRAVRRAWTNLARTNLPSYSVWTGPISAQNDPDKAVAPGADDRECALRPTARRRPPCSSAGVWHRAGGRRAAAP